MPQTPEILNDQRINPALTRYGDLLKNLQGNILKGHGRDFSVHLFLRLKGQPSQCISGLASLVPLVTAMDQQLRETEQFKQYHIPGGLFCNLAISAKGYGKLGKALPSQDPFFKSGMIATAGEFLDPPAASFEDGYEKGDIDLVVLLADDDEGFLLRKTRDLLDQLQRCDWSEVAAVEVGRSLRNEAGEGIEHFGYVDGRSQPLYLLSDLCDEIDARTSSNIDKWDPSEPLRRVLVVDPLAPADAKDAFGSLMVFRKLEQNVQAFKIREQELAAALGLHDDDRERAGAMVVGRFEDGTPLVLSQVDGLIPIKENNFTYANDTDGLKCPFHAHIRKTNPRGDTVRKFGVSDEEERSHRITRRAIAFGTRKKKPAEEQTLEELPTGEVGLLFVCLQASIKDQFAFIQGSWASSTGFLNPNTGIDPVIGQVGAGDAISKQTWRPQYGKDAVPPPNAPPCPVSQQAVQPVTFDFGNFVTMKGGEFFFIPSMPFLENLVAPSNVPGAAKPPAAPV